MPLGLAHTGDATEKIFDRQRQIGQTVGFEFLMARVGWACPLWFLSLRSAGGERAGLMPTARRDEACGPEAPMQGDASERRLPPTAAPNREGSPPHFQIVL